VTRQKEEEGAILAWNSKKERSNTSYIGIVIIGRNVCLSGKYRIVLKKSSSSSKQFEGQVFFN